MARFKTRRAQPVFFTTSSGETVRLYIRPLSMSQRTHVLCKYQALEEADVQRLLIRYCVQGWRDFENEHGAKLDYSPELLDSILGQDDRLADEVYCYLFSMTGLLDDAPDGGPVVTAAQSPAEECA